MAEPVTAHTERFVRAVWSLDRDLAYARHYPAVSWTASASRDVPPVGRWYAREAGDHAWAERRARAVRLLSEADRVQAVAELVGAASLPDRERVVLLTGRLLREAVLEQNALSANDAWSAPAKQAALLGMVLAIHDRAADLIERGVAGARIVELDYSDAARARDRVPGDDAAGVDAVRDALLERMEALL
jgi:V/A-type H+-transporting ATPase subunit A